MDKLTPAQERTIGTVVQRLIKAARPPADLSSDQALKLGNSLKDLANDFPGIVSRSPAFVTYASQVLAAYDIKAGTQAGLWSQASTDRAAELRSMIIDASQQAS